MISTLSPEPSSIVARKRRRQILQSQRTKNEDVSVAPPLKKKCIEPITNCDKVNTSSKAKKPQMRYDPEVPMTKEEAATWRKEQRRKRNRESAAASRQRQRDRIAELEEEVSEWKSKYEEALERIEKLEQLRERSLADCSSVCPMSPPESAAVSPYSSPRHSPSSPLLVSDASCGVVSLHEQNLCAEMEGTPAHQVNQEQEANVKHLSEKISRPAVKITGATHAASVPELPMSSGLLPDPCTSLSSNTMPLLTDVTPSSSGSPVLESDESLSLPDELEFDEFLLDAAEWL